MHSAGELLHTPLRISTSMTIFLLSKCVNTLCGIWWTIFWHLNLWFGSSRIACPAYQGRPTRGLHLSESFTKVNHPSCLFKVWEFRRGLSVPKTANHYLYPTQLHAHGYPEGNFGKNQLLDSSISLSPLYSDLTIDLHVRTATSFHQGFPWLHPLQAKFTIFRVSSTSLKLKPISRDQSRSTVQKISSLLLSFRVQVCHSHTCDGDELLGPCFKTGRIKRCRHRPRTGILRLIIARQQAL